MEQKETIEKKTVIHYCNTCKYSDVSIKDAPCKECLPKVFGGPDKWEERNQNLLSRNNL